MGGVCGEWNRGELGHWVHWGTRLRCRLRMCTPGWCGVVCFEQAAHVNPVCTQGCGSGHAWDHWGVDKGRGASLGSSTLDTH
eukprot:scaffold20991_cov15-Tisochrysis_lutea.AAC.3